MTIRTCSSKQFKFSLTFNTREFKYLLKRDSNSSLNKDSKGLYKNAKKRSDQDGEDLADNHRLYANTT